MFATAARWAAKKGKPKMAPIELTTAPEQAQSITRTIFDVVKEHGPLTISDVWEHVKDVGLRGLTGKRQMKIMLRWMREKQKLRLICDHDGPHKQFLYTTWFTNPKNAPQRPKRELNKERIPSHDRTHVDQCRAYLVYTFLLTFSLICRQNC
uniref:Uncharacterized protein n=1 Tax=Aegilops tauschii subsp. strangulata TaxID=200361 RepID=A0A453GJ20_AEGTS